MGIHHLFDLVASEELGSEPGESSSTPSGLGLKPAGGHGDASCRYPRGRRWDGTI